MWQPSLVHQLKTPRIPHGLFFLISSAPVSESMIYPFEITPLPASRFRASQAPGASVQAFLYQPVGVGRSGAPNPGGTTVKTEAASDEVDRYRAEKTVDGTNATVDLGSRVGRRHAKA